MSLRISGCPKRDQVTEKLRSPRTLNKHTIATTYSRVDLLLYSFLRTSVCHLHLMIALLNLRILMSTVQCLVQVFPTSLQSMLALQIWKKKNIIMIMITIDCVVRMPVITVSNPRLDLVQALHGIAKYVQRFNGLPVLKSVS